MLTFTRVHDVGESKRENVPLIKHKWKLTDSRAPILPDGERYADVCELEANGDELKYIRIYFKNIPDVPSSPTMVWRGSMAQFIYENMLTSYFG